ncbi:TetR/AcrR family transcriptional regulator [Melioribacter sp. OK-6-Me]|uniref:TetR/AcrR family transcriptional regulator n=1 Tax=unclassified Melioribacter TaxID=2627329 RepID=UPI003ED9F968
MATERLNTETRQAQIKKAVLDIISTEGIGKLSTRNLASKIGVTEGAIFRHYSSKKDIMLSILEDVKNELLAAQEEITYSADLNAEEKLFKFLCKHIKYLVENRGITILLFSEAAHMNDSQLKSGLRDILLTQKEFISRIIKQGMNEGLWDKSLNIDNVATLYMGIPISLNIEMILQKVEPKKEKFCEKMICLIKRVLEKK